MAETLVGSAGGWSAITAHWERMPSSAAAVRWWMAVACSGTHKIPKLGVTGSRGARVTQEQDSGCSENRVAMRFSRP